MLPLGADLGRAPRGQGQTAGRRRSLLCVGILEPRKNQLFLLDVCEELWASGMAFELHIVGRVNPHFGAPVVARIKSAKKRYPGLQYHEAARDDVLAGLYGSVRATIFPTIAEGCGLPLLESLWHGVPCVCSDLPVLRENADGGGCLALAPNDRVVWREGIRALLTDDGLYTRLAAEAASRSLPTWGEAARVLLQRLN